jgi:hypothetical protein
MTDEDLLHYGVKGMQWGVTNSIASNAREMSSVDLTSAVKRMELEKRYVSLSDPISKKTQNFIVESITNSIKQEVRRGFDKAVGVIVQEAVRFVVRA